MSAQEQIELMLVNPSSDILDDVGRELSRLTDEGWTTYSRPDRGNHPALQVRRKDRFQIVLLDLGPDMRGPDTLLMRATPIPDWLHRDVLSRAGTDSLVVLLAPEPSVLALESACRRLASASYRTLPLARERQYWEREGLAFGDELFRLWHERTDPVGKTSKWESWFAPRD